MFEKIFNDNVTGGFIISGLTRELKGLYVFNFFSRTDKSVLVVVNSLYESNIFYRILSNYTSDILLFQMDDFLTSEALAVSPELAVSRLETLGVLARDNSKKIVICNLNGYLRFLPSKSLFNKKIITLSVGSDYNISSLEENFFDIGYVRETMVNKTGEVAVRGYVIDVFPVSFVNPIRIEFWGDTIESIKYFDVDTQRTIKSIDNVSILPNTEFLAESDVLIQDRKQKNLNLYTDVCNIYDYMNKGYVFFNNYNDILLGMDTLREDMYNYSISMNEDGNRVYMHDLANLDCFSKFYLNDFDNIINRDECVLYDAHDVNNFSGTIDSINERLNGYLKNYTVIICLEDRYRVNKLIDELKNNNIVFTNENEIYNNKINVIVKKISYGFQFNGYVVISENEIFNKKVSGSTYKTNFKIGIRIKDINKLEIGDYIVHCDHGIGKYAGIKTLDKNGLLKDYILLEYRDGDKLYIPVEKIDFISKYSASEGREVSLNKLGGSEWAKTKARASKRIESIASDLLALYAAREASVGFKFETDTKDQYDFENQFEFSMTPDQLKVTEEIKGDMESVKPMDRLLCGDVGYGKTEVAFRAIFKAIMSGKQVAFLCPTTILSNQHYNNAINRFRNFPINIEVLNRFVPTSRVNNILERLKNGQIDLLIGTHRILSSDVVYRDLGLLVIDEEQRFGVKHKEKIKEYKNNIDVLTLSATPIPRTLQMSMVGIRNLSLIETPPTNRFPIQTYVLEENNQIIKDAIYKEFSRNGQVFILYNRIVDMDSKIREIKKIVPDALIDVAHGKMTKNQIENVIQRFIDNKFNVLLCTTIIETGIDIPNVNTLIIMDADKFGLSQLYQIRGRVGRSDRIAYCYLMYCKHKMLSEVATKRLKAIKEFTCLGSGFSIAMRDLAIRGAGDILGSEQAGFVDSIGIDLFLDMLNEQVKKIKGEEVPLVTDNRNSILPLLEVSTSIDDAYVDDPELKILIHKKINTIDSIDKLKEVKGELEDRFGNVSDDMIIYMYQELFEKLANRLNIVDIKQGLNSIEVYLPTSYNKIIDVKKLFMDVLEVSRMFRFSMKGNRILITLDIVKLDKHFVYYMVELMNIIQKNIIEYSN